MLESAVGEKYDVKRSQSISWWYPPGSSLTEEEWKLSESSRGLCGRLSHLLKGNQPCLRSPLYPLYLAARGACLIEPHTQPTFRYVSVCVSSSRGPVRSKNPIGILGNKRYWRVQSLNIKIAWNDIQESSFKVSVHSVVLTIEGRGCKSQEGGCSMTHCATEEGR